MIVRESPRKQNATWKVAWPPKSPRDVLTASPSRRSRLQERRGRSATSLSPSRDATNGTNHAASQIKADMSDIDDEETLQLQLAAIEARLKLKKLRQAKSGTEHEQHGENLDLHRSRQSMKRAAIASLQVPDIQVSQSPRKKGSQTISTSPKRVQLGIDKGLRASEVSLQKYPSGGLQENGSHALRKQSSFAERLRDKHESYGERLARIRTQDAEKRQKRDKISTARCKGFGIGSDASRTSHQNVSGTVPGELSPQQHVKSVKHSSQESFKIGPSAFVKNCSSKDIDTFSGLHLSKRFISSEKLEEAFEDKVMMSIPKLLKDVKSPDYDPPDIEGDFVVFGVIATKSAPRAHEPANRTMSNGDPDDPAMSKSKFMIIQLTDLQWEISLFLFDTAFESFWKLTVGTVLAILNPGIMPPKPHMRDTGQFSLKLTSSDDTLLQIGQAKDIGFCKSLKKDGNICGQWINNTKTEVCEFHVSMAVQRSKAGRMETNGMGGLELFMRSSHGKARGNAKRSWTSRYGSPEGQRGKRDCDRKQGRYYDREAHATAYVMPIGPQGLSAASLLDAEDYSNREGSRAERHQRRLAAQEREHGLAKKLGSHGGGLGGEYMRHKSDLGIEAADRKPIHEQPVVNASSLGLVRSSESAVRLSPNKGGKFRHAATDEQPRGWGGANKRGLGSPNKEERPSKNARLEGGNGGNITKSQFLDKTGRRVVVANLPRKPIEKKGVQFVDEDDLDIV